MKSCIQFILLAAFLFVVGCGSDNPVNNNGGGPTGTNYTVDSLLIEMDSAAVYGPDTTTIVYPLFTDSTDEGYKVSYTGETNTNLSFMVLYFYRSGTLHNHTNSGMSMNGNHEYIVDARNFNTAAYFGAGMSNADTSLSSYVKILNLKIWRIRYN